MENGHAPAAPPSADYNPPFGPEEVSRACKVASGGGGWRRAGARRWLPSLPDALALRPCPGRLRCSGARWATPWWTSSPTTRRALSRCPCAAKCSPATCGEGGLPPIWVAVCVCCVPLADRLTSRPGRRSRALTAKQQPSPTAVIAPLWPHASLAAASTRPCRPCLPDHAPEEPESIEQILADVSQHIMPGMTHWQSPRFFGWFRCGGRLLVRHLCVACAADGSGSSSGSGSSGVLAGISAAAFVAG